MLLFCTCIVCHPVISVLSGWVSCLVKVFMVSRAVLLLWHIKCASQTVILTVMFDQQTADITPRGTEHDYFGQSLCGSGCYCWLQDRLQRSSCCWIAALGCACMAPYRWLLCVTNCVWMRHVCLHQAPRTLLQCSMTVRVCAFLWV